MDKIKSVWSETATLPQFDTLKNDIKTDVLIIGGGITGVLCAYYLRQNGIAYTLVEANRLCAGITKNTTAKITSQHGFIYDRLIRKFGAEKASGYLRANEAALTEYRRLAKTIDCDFEEKNNFVYTLKNSSKAEKEMRALEKLGFCAEYCDSLTIPLHITGAVKFPKQAQFNPMKFISGVAHDMNIYENTAVREFTGTAVVTDYGKITADKIIVATHFPIFNKHGFYFMKMYQQRSYVIALENAGEVNGMYVDEAEKGLSFRNYQKLLLLGGGGHKTGKNGGGWTELEEFAAEKYPGAKKIFQWAAQDCMTLDSVPYIGRYSSRTNDLYVASGYNKWGMTSAMAAAKILSDTVLGRKNEYADIFSPLRSSLHPQLAANIFEASVGLLTPTSKRCPHLGCALKWNRAERSWDCPCHGSRFTQDGKLIDNPATGDIHRSR